MNTQILITDINMKKLNLCCFTGILLLLFACGTCAKPLYVLGEAVFGLESNIKTFNVFQNGTLEYVGNDTLEIRCKGPVDLALTPNGRNMFTVSGGSAWVQIVDTTTMTVAHEAHVSGTREDFSGVAFDSKRNLVYSVDMGQDQLYVHHWDGASGSLTLAENGRITLPGTTTIDLALDLAKDLLFVTNGTNEVHVFNLIDWSLNKIIMLGHHVERIDLDVRNQMLYAGTVVGGDPYLVQYDLLTTVERAVQIGDDASIVGIAVDGSTSLIYVATFHPFYIEAPNKVHVFDGELRSIDQAEINENVAGLGVPVEGASYSPITVSKRIVSGTEFIGDMHYITAGDIVTYEIRLGVANPGDNLLIHGGAIIDNLPFELEYISSSNFNNVIGVYDPNLHAVTWIYPSMPLIETLTVGLEARVRLNVAPGKITNAAAVVSSGGEPMIALADAFVKAPSDPDTQASLTVYSSEIVGGTYSDELLAILVFPPHINLNHVDKDIPLILDPGGAEASFQVVYGKDGKVVMDAYFNKANLLAIIEGQNKVTVSLMVTGRLLDGSQFFGETTVPVAANLLLQE